MKFPKQSRDYIDKILSNNIIFYGIAILLGSGIGAIISLARPNLDELPNEIEFSGVSDTSAVEEKKEDNSAEEKKEEKKAITEEEKAAEQKSQATTAGPSSTPATSKQSQPTTNNSTPSTSNNSTNSRATTNITGLPDTISRYEWVRQGGWKKLVEAAYFKATRQGALPVVDGVDNTVLYYHIIGVATDPCYATITAELEVDGETRMKVALAELIAAPSAICDNMRPQTISVPSLSILTDYLKQLEAEHGLYQKIKGGTIR